MRLWPQRQRDLAAGAPNELLIVADAAFLAHRRRARSG
jgi:hypothetical protein